MPSSPRAVLVAARTSVRLAANGDICASLRRPSRNLISCQWVKKFGWPASEGVPGIVAFKMFPNLPKPDQAYLVLVQQLIPTGLKGLLLAGMGAALMSTVSTVLNSASTLVTIDLYKRAIHPNVTEAQQVRIGRWSGVVILLASIWVAISSSWPGGPKPSVNSLSSA